MNKKLISGVAALTIAAGLGIMNASAVKLGNVNKDEKIDIEDAVAVISHVNGVKALTPDEEKISDVDKSGKVDIEDAVKIIAHVNGVSRLPDEEIATDGETTTAEDSSKTDNSSTSDTAAVKVTLADTGDCIELKKGDTIPQKYGMFPDQSDSSTWDKDSWYLKFSGETFTKPDGKVYEKVVSSIKDEATGVELQDFIKDGKLVNEDTTFKITFTEKLLAEPKAKINFWNNYADFDTNNDPDVVVYLFDNADDGRTVLTYNELSNITPQAAPRRDWKFEYWTDLSTNYKITDDISSSKDLIANYSVLPKVTYRFLDEEGNADSTAHGVDLAKINKDFADEYFMIPGDTDTAIIPPSQYPDYTPSDPDMVFEGWKEKDAGSRTFPKPSGTLDPTKWEHTNDQVITFIPVLSHK